MFVYEKMDELSFGSIEMIDEVFANIVSLNFQQRLLSLRSISFYWWSYIPPSYVDWNEQQLW